MQVILAYMGSGRGYGMFTGYGGGELCGYATWDQQVSDFGRGYAEDLANPELTYSFGSWEIAMPPELIELAVSAGVVDSVLAVHSRLVRNAT